MMLRMLYFEVQIDRHGPEWCERKLIGAMRRKAETPHFTAVSIITDGGRPLQDVRSSCAKRLAIFCGLCGRCEMSKMSPV